MSRSLAILSKIKSSSISSANSKRFAALVASGRLSRLAIRDNIMFKLGESEIFILFFVVGIFLVYQKCITVVKYLYQSFESFRIQRILISVLDGNFSGTHQVQEVNGLNPPCQILIRSQSLCLFHASVFPESNWTPHYYLIISS